jgi:hypothetical protein
MRKSLSLALAGAALLIAATTASAAPITYNFTTELPLGTTYGTGSFTFDDALLSGPLPHLITTAQISGFTYTDPTAGTLNYSVTAPASLNFTLNFTAATSLFALVAVDGGRGLVATVSGLNDVGLDISFGPTGVANPILRFPTVSTQPSTVPEPTSLLLIGSGLLGLASARRRRR